MAKSPKDESKSKSSIDQPSEAQPTGASPTSGKVGKEAGQTEEVIWLPIDQIKIGKRFRKMMGDLEPMKRSLLENGQISPIAVQKSDYTLIFGERRLAAMKELGADTIMASLRDYNQLDSLLVEYDENAVRKQFCPSEAVEAKRRIEPILKEEGEKRKKEGAKRGGKKAGKRGVRAKKTRDEISQRLGLSHDTMKKAEEIVSAVEKEPENKELLKILEEMDQTSNVSGAYRKFKQLNKQTARVLLNKFLPIDSQENWFRWAWKPTQQENQTLLEDALKAPFDTVIPPNKVDISGWNHVAVEDIFGSNVKKDLIQRILKICEDTPHWTYVFSTSHPERLSEFKFHQNCWVGACATTQEEVEKAIESLKETKAPVRFLELKSLPQDLEFSTLEPVDWLVLDAGKGGKQPSWDRVMELEGAADDHEKKVYYTPSLDWKKIAPSSMPEME